MSRLFKQIQQAQPKMPVFIAPLETSIKQQQKFNLLPFFCIVALFIGIIMSYLYTERSAQPATSGKELSVAAPIQETPKDLAKDLREPITEVIEEETSAREKDFEAIFPEKSVALDEDANEELVFRSLQWNFAPLKKWIREQWEQTFPRLQAFRNSLSRFDYLDATQPIPEREISAVEKEHLEHIRRFLKKFKVDAVRIDGSYSRVMANGQAFYVNTVVSQRPRLKLTGITSQEMIFKDEYNQEYKKEISQND